MVPHLMHITSVFVPIHGILTTTDITCSRGVTLSTTAQYQQEGKKFATFAGSHSVGIMLLALAGGTLIALSYNLIHTAFIQRTTSVFVAVAGKLPLLLSYCLFAARTCCRIKIIVSTPKGNFKIAVLILLSELLAQTTNLPPLAILGITVVCLCFFLSFVEREIQKRPWLLGRTNAEGVNRNKQKYE